MLELKDLENRSIYILREAYAEFKRPAVLWSTGKDSTATLWLCRKAFFGKIPFPVIHIDIVYTWKPINNPDLEKVAEHIYILRR